MKLLIPKPSNGLLNLFHRGSFNDLFPLLSQEPDFEIGLWNVLEEHVIPLGLTVVNVHIEAKIALSVQG